jgi:hypothetical protein
MPRTYTRKTKVVDKISKLKTTITDNVTSTVETDSEKLKLLLPKRPKVFFVFDYARVHIVDDNLYTTNDFVKKHFIIYNKETKNEIATDKSGNSIYLEKTIKVEDENGVVSTKVFNVLKFIEKTIIVETRLPSQVFNIKDIKLQDKEITDYFDKNPKINIKGQEVRVKQFQNWLIQAEKQPENDNKYLINTWLG